MYNIILEDMYFKENFAGIGGVLYITQSINVKINRCLFRDNMGSLRGGSINLDVFENAMISNSHFINNSILSIDG